LCTPHLLGFARVRILVLLRMQHNHILHMEWRSMLPRHSAAGARLL
jgi:hypothetical protein